MFCKDKEKNYYRRFRVDKMEIKKPRRKTKDMVLCVSCKKPIHADDLGMITKEGLWHKQCLFRILYQTPDCFLTGVEVKVKSSLLEVRNR